MIYSRRMKTIQGHKKDEKNAMPGKICYYVKLTGIQERVIKEVKNKLVYFEDEDKNFGRAKQTNCYMDKEFANRRLVKDLKKFMEINNLELISFIEVASNAVKDNLEYFV